MNKRIIFVNGEKYPLKDYFSGINEKIVIPDLQRDYCWGSQGLVESFMDSIINLDQRSSITLGLIYGYIDKDLIEEHMQLCDGQQRLTTLFLIVGTLARMTGDGYLMEHLVSDFELNDDDREPYLLYAIRESSLYFLSDLTYYYFLRNTRIESVDDLKLQPWFLDCYYQDPSIISMLDALKTIEDKLINSEPQWLIDFGHFLLDKVEMLYVDMESREKGEETFVVINTTGEPLTKNENLKPKIIYNNHNIADVSQRWEKMEQWFWRHRNKERIPQHTSDEGMSQFIRIARLLQAESIEDYILIRRTPGWKPFENIPFDDIEDMFNAYTRLYTMGGFDLRYDKHPDYTDNYTEAELYAILPTLKFILRFEGFGICDEKIRRVYHLFSNMSRYRNTDVDESNNIAPAFRAINAISELVSPDIAALFASDYLPSDEREKCKQLSEWCNLEGDETNPREVAVADAERNEIFRGRIEEIIRWSNGDFDRFSAFLCRFKQLWPRADGHDLDNLRRRLLSLSLQDYPQRYNKKTRMRENR